MAPPELTPPVSQAPTPRGGRPPPRSPSAGGAPTGLRKSPQPPQSPQPPAVPGERDAARAFLFKAAGPGACPPAIRVEPPTPPQDDPAARRDRGGVPPPSLPRRKAAPRRPASPLRDPARLAPPGAAPELPPDGGAPAVLASGWKAASPPQPPARDTPAAAPSRPAGIRKRTIISYIGLFLLLSLMAGQLLSLSPDTFAPLGHAMSAEEPLLGKVKIMSWGFSSILAIILIWRIMRSLEECYRFSRGPRRGPVPLDVNRTVWRSECLDYVDDMFRCISRSEMRHLPRPGDMAAKQVEVTADMRRICLNWIIECANRLNMKPATIFLAGNVLDRFLAAKAIKRERIQIVSMVSLVVAAKYQEINPPKIEDYIHISARAFTRGDLSRYEDCILHALGASLTVPTPHYFIGRLLFALKDTGRPETREQQEVRHASLFIAECAMLKLSLYLEPKPSRLAAGSVFAARQMLGRHPVWPSEVAGVCEYDAHAVGTTAAVLLAHAREVRDGPLQATVARYAEEARCAVSRRL